MVIDRQLKNSAGGLSVLITRPFRQALRTAKILTEDGHICRIEPLLTIHSVASEPPAEDASAVAVTSVNAIPALRDLPELKDLPAYCTGESTGQALKNIGFEDIRIAQGGAKALASLIAAIPPTEDGPVLYPCASLTAHDLGHFLSRHGIACRSWVVYEAREVPEFSPETREALITKRLDVVLLYSTRTASAFCRLFETMPPQTPWPHLVALSEEICAGLPKPAQVCCQAAREPNEKAVRFILAQMMR